jgi:hypothetical protein
MLYATLNCWVFGLCPFSGILTKLENTTFRKLDLFPSSGYGWETATLLGPLERANLNHWTQQSRCPPPLTWGRKQIHFPKRCFSEYRTVDARGSERGACVSVGIAALTISTYKTQKEKCSSSSGSSSSSHRIEGQVPILQSVLQSRPLPKTSSHCWQRAYSVKLWFNMYRSGSMVRGL